MGDLKSKLPDLNEVVSMMDKLYQGIKCSVVGIIHDYKEKHAQNDASIDPVKPAAAAKDATVTPKAATTAKPKAAKSTTAAKSVKSTAKITATAKKSTTAPK